MTTYRSQVSFKVAYWTGFDEFEYLQFAWFLYLVTKHYLTSGKIDSYLMQCFLKTKWHLDSSGSFPLKQ